MTGRPQIFDEETAIKSAMGVFWAYGLEAASYAKLAEAMRLNRPSIYGAFGDKETLFLRTTDFYLDTYTKPTLAKLGAGKTFKESLISFLDQVISIARIKCVRDD